jgi:hypothetical protein
MFSTKPVVSVGSYVIFGWVTKVSLPLLTSARPRSIKILDRLPHACAADFEPLDQAVFRQQLGLWRQAADSDMTPSSVSSASGKWTPHEPLIILLLANRPFLIAS